MCEYNQFGQALGVALPDWQPRPWPTRQVLQGSRCRLEPLDSCSCQRSVRRSPAGARRPQLDVAAA